MKNYINLNYNKNMTFYTNITWKLIHINLLEYIMFKNINYNYWKYVLIQFSLFIFYNFKLIDSYFYQILLF